MDTYTCLDGTSIDLQLLREAYGQFLVSLLVELRMATDQLAVHFRVQWQPRVTVQQEALRRRIPGRQAPLPPEAELLGKLFDDLIAN